MYLFLNLKDEKPASEEQIIINMTYEKVKQHIQYRLFY